MAKTKGKKKAAAKKRTVTCGKCKEPGHNARTCLGDAPVAEAEAPPAPPKPKRTKIDTREKEERRHSRVPKRAAPTADIGSAVAPSFRCPKCSAVAILVIVRVKDENASFKKKKLVYKGEVRCEKCMNKPTPSDLILKWGALPGQMIEPEQPDA